MPLIDPLWGIVLGHLLGDYVFQNQWMALAKNRSTFRCTLHCVVYTLCVAMFTSWRPLWLLAVFLSHFPIDRWSLGERWQKLIGGRSIEEFIQHGHENQDLPTALGSLAPQRSNYVAARGGFTVLVFAVTDNTFHLLLMFLAWAVLGRP